MMQMVGPILEGGPTSNKQSNGRQAKSWALQETLKLILGMQTLGNANSLEYNPQVKLGQCVTVGPQESLIIQTLNIYPHGQERNVMLENMFL